MRRSRSDLRSRRVYYGALGLILLIGAALTAIGVTMAGAAQDVLINLGSSVLGVFLVAVVLEPIIKFGRRYEEQIHGGFPHRRFLDGVAGCSQRVRIMGAWPYVMETQWRAEFLDALLAAIRRNAQVEILILDPTSPAAMQRRTDMRDSTEISRLVTEILAALDAFRARVPREKQTRLHVRIYNTLPPARLYRWDNRALSSFFPAGDRWGSDVRHYETNVTSGLGHFVDDQFSLIWNDKRSRDLTTYLRLPLRIQATGRTFHARYVILDDGLYAIAPELTDSLMRNASTDWRVCVEDTPDRDYTAQGVPDDDDEAWESILEFYTLKYGEPTTPGRLPGTIRLVEQP
ncbi:hypothetical protein JIG36_13530 [Actinoplanes sp. LDG1-06]|uniref:Uncharacterized protein n=1 Tax=Paractinoplanes ovalisporus TaxID=2810368 RepID=A0ABS2A9Z8_9ACTN|nr:hypothetical protein [Actinoplanes ovalisporus]MBM2616580.1 hypothetical protein [Actinoplanes ovalisporus]